MKHHAMQEGNLLPLCYDMYVLHMDLLWSVLCSLQESPVQELSRSRQLQETTSLDILNLVLLRLEGRPMMAQVTCQNQKVTNQNQKVTMMMWMIQR
eukprot:13471280-Ditylum_brightwellii.AAC.1